MNNMTRENIEKASQTASLLVQDLRELTRAGGDPLLAELALDMLETAAQLEQKLKRIQAVVTA